MTEQNLENKYDLFKKLPLIIALLIIGIFAIAAIAFIALDFFWLGLAILLFGVVLAKVVYEIMLIFISPLVITTDYVLSLKYSEKVQAANPNTAVNNKTYPKATVHSKAPSGKRWLCKSCGSFNDSTSSECKSCYARRSD